MWSWTMSTVKIRKIGNSFGITFPKKLIERFHLKEGDVLNLTEDNTVIRLTPYDADFEEWVNNFEKTNRKFRNVLKKLAE